MPSDSESSSSLSSVGMSEAYHTPFHRLQIRTALHHVSECVCLLACECLRLRRLLPASNRHSFLPKRKVLNERCGGQTAVCQEADHSLPGSVPEKENVQTHCCSVVVFCLNESAQTFSRGLTKPKKVYSGLCLHGLSAKPSG